MTDDFDKISAALTGDKRAVLKDQLKRLEREVVERLLIDVLTRANVEEEVRDIRNEILNLQPADGQPDNPTERSARLTLKKECLDLTKELRVEQRDCWRDVQNLQREEREVEKELLLVHQRDKRLRDFDET